MPYEYKKDRVDFPDGTSAILETYKSEKGNLAMATRHGVNPFNHGGELQDRRLELAETACSWIGCEPRELNYMEQVNQSWANVAFDAGPDGKIKAPLDDQVISRRDDQIKAEVNRHTENSVGQELNHSPEWASHLKPPRSGPDR